MANRITAVFDDRSRAEQAVTELRRLGLRDDQLSVLTRQGKEMTTTGEGTMAEATSPEREEHGDTAAERAGKGALAGAGVGTLFGLAAALIPGVGPFITAGWLATVLGSTAGGAAAGAIVGGTAGAIAGALSKAGYEESEAHYYGEAVERGDTLVAIDTTNSALTDDQIRSVLSQYGGRFYQRGQERAA
ncbi:MAG: hypothetical protein ACYDBB_16375 [Armatimonadota bacterium]